MTDDTNYEYTAYDIECLLHVYNRFILISPPKPITDFTNMQYSAAMTLRLDKYNNNHPHKLSDELANLLGEPINTFMSINNIIVKLRTYCEANHLVLTADNYQSFGAIINDHEPLLQLMDIGNYLVRKGNNNWISYSDIAQCLIKKGSVQMYIPDSGYVLK
jgi:hypothetical protein